MSSVFSKNKEKRPRTSSNEANTSFVKNVTSRVSGLLPSTITKWFSSPSSSNANGSAPTADATDSSTEDEATETPVVTQPPAKRMRFNTPGKYNNFGSTDVRCSTSSIEITEIPYSPFTGSQFSQTSRSSFMTPKSSQTLRPPNEDKSKEKLKIDKETSTRVFKPQHTVSSIGQSVANKRKSIFATNTEEETPKPSASKSTVTTKSPDNKQPSFKPSLLGSPFYAGRTMYGGASSPYINQPNIKQETVAVVNEAKSNNDEDTALSSAARRIMELLDSYSTPLMEARRVPTFSRPKNASLNTTDRFSPYTNKSYPYKTQELHVPSYASILRLKKKSRLMDTTNAARQIIASHSSASNYTPITTATKTKEYEKEQSDKMTTKVKARVTRTNRGNDAEMEVVTPVKLPTAVLHIDSNNLPKFSFGTPGPALSKVPTATATSTPKVVFPAVDKKLTPVCTTTSKPETVTSSVFTFSKPVTVTTEVPQIDSISTKFRFGSPERSIDKAFESKRDETSVVVGTVKETEKSTSNTKDWQCSECWVKNKSDADKCVCCGAKQPSAKTKCTVCKLADSQSQKDKCVNCEKMQTQATTPFAATSTGVSQSTKWKCEDCWVSNDNSAVKCACCGGSRPNKANVSTASTSIATSATVTNTFQTAATKSGSDWKCNDCWITNKDSAEKCVACGGAKPGNKQNTVSTAPAPTSSFFGSTDSTFKNLASSQKSAKWECTSCLVLNDKEKDKCACCGAEKESDKEKKLPESKFNFNSLANNSFKFGIDPKVQEAKIAKKPELQSSVGIKLKEQSETNNNVLSETPTFTFTLPTNKVENKTVVPKLNSVETPKMNFSFGIPKQLPTATETNKSVESTKQKEDEEKPQEVPSVDLNASVADKPKPIATMFGIPPSQTNNEKNNKTLPSTDDSKKTNAGISLPVIPASSNAVEAPKPSFTFGVPTPKPNVFGAPETPATTAASISIFAQPTQSTTEPTTSAPSLSLFKPPESSIASSSLFQKPDAVKPAPLFQNSETTSTANAAPIFSFGNNASNNPISAPAPTLAPAPDAPKFQFTFGSSSTPKTESPSLFKSPFGATETNNTNTFAMPAGTTLGTSNAATPNALGGSNGLSGTNGLSGNTLTGGSLGSLTGNPLTGSNIAGNALTGGNSVMTNNLGAVNGLPTLAGGNNGLQAGSTLTGSAPLFGNNVQKENVWAASNNAPAGNLFVSNTATSSLQKPSAQFTFGSSTPFNAANTTPAFGNNSAPPQNIFGMGNQSNNPQPTLFSNAVQSQPTGNLFGSPPPASSAPQMGMFGTPNIGAAPAFGSPNPSIPSFEAPSLTPAPAAPAFNFGAPSPSTGIFGFGQQQMQQPAAPALVAPSPSPQTPVYSFGGAPAGAPQVQFTIGSGANTAVRRVRKAVRRNPQR